jgi:hypothetical protein
MGVVDTPPASRADADKIEAALIGERDQPAIEEFAAALGTYGPTNVPAPHMYGFADIRSAARDALHDLNQHDRCLHDLPLMERP